ncbi:uncharacterized protein F4822DRAFT_422100 [Hypoxylon trugodes]|uniref:uncharacterized protein n=1 Tax=Hypoxylon trugodes TaxID=326681 RepID=UPI002196F32C|nr:uncharacterized protein F4822DRAFT_422100 [Hypoxylon trugodes]KAI1383081.1 hypothetical protein F4822DRAFT_422100 [Hypoxylon trugodes]
MKNRTNSIRTPGWRRTGIFSIISTLSCGIVLLVWFVRAIQQEGSSVYSTTTIFEGNCVKAKRFGLLIHAFLIIVSSLILASFRFFMQILSSPSRAEIDRAHSELRSLEIGVSSIKNLRYVSWIKTVAWVVLLASSIPIHLFFNSSIFETIFQGSDWRLTIASSSFSSQEVSFFPPGASLMNAGIPSTGWDSSTHNHAECSKMSGFGEHVALTEYWDRSSLVNLKITKTANESKLWNNMTSQECLEEYASCKPRNKYRDVVIVVDTGTNRSGGWMLSGVFSDPYNELESTWEHHIPWDSLNSLWYSTQCATTLTTSPVFRDAKTSICTNTCGWVLGLGTAYPLTNMSSTSGSVWTPPLPACDVPNKERLGYNDKFNTLSVRYCLAEPSPANICRVELSNVLLLATIVCVFSKVFICTLIIYYLLSESLVTLGDALGSFILNPDPITLGFGTLSISDSLQLQSGAHRKLQSDGTMGPSERTQPRRWRNHKTNKIISAIPKSAWSSTFAPIILCLCVGLYYAIQVDVMRRLDGRNSIGESGVPFFVGSFVNINGYLPTLLVANLPQFILSYCFFSYNSFFTRLVAEKEFNSYSLTPYKPLRVSYPTGEQVSTYWLQLPCKYSIPLLITSTVLHWLASNSTFLFVSYGGYLFNPYYDSGVALNGAEAVLGFYPLAILIFFSMSVIVVFIPILFGIRRIPGDMVIGACDSLVLSAACHLHVPPTTSDDNSGDEDTEMGRSHDREFLLELSRSKLRWGVMSLPPELAEMVHNKQDLFHLTFTNEDGYLSGPMSGEFHC